MAIIERDLDTYIYKVCKSDRYGNCVPLLLLYIRCVGLIGTAIVCLYCSYIYKVCRLEWYDDCVPLLLLYI
jgi:hypothetical protein